MIKEIISVLLLACCSSALEVDNEMIRCLEPPRALQIWYEEDSQYVVYEDIEMYIIYNKASATEESSMGPTSLLIEDSRILLEAIYKVSPEQYRIPNKPTVIPTSIRVLDKSLPSNVCSVLVTKSQQRSNNLSRELEEKLLEEAANCLKLSLCLG